MKTPMTAVCKLMYVLEGMVIRCLFLYKAKRLSREKFRITKSNQFLPSGIVKSQDHSPTDVVGVKSLHRLKW